MSNRLETVDDQIVQQLLKRIEEEGAKSVAEALGITKESLYRVACGLPITNHMAALVNQHVKVSPL